MIASPGTRQGSKRSRHRLELPANHISPPPSRDKHRQKHQRRKVIFYNPRILLIIVSHRTVANQVIHYVCSLPLPWTKILLDCAALECVISIPFNLNKVFSHIWLLMMCFKWSNFAAIFLAGGKDGTWPCRQALHSVLDLDYSLI